MLLLSLRLAIELKLHHLTSMGKNRLNILHACLVESKRYQSDDIFTSFTKCYFVIVSGY